MQVYNTLQANFDVEALKQVKLSLRSVCVAFTCLDDFSTTFVHVHYEVADGLLRNLIPGLDKSIHQLSMMESTKMALVDWARHVVADVLNRIQVWGTGRPIHSFNAFLLQELLTHSIHIKTSIVEPKEEPSANGYSICSHKGSEDLILVLNASQATSIEYVKGCMAFQRNATPQPYWSTAQLGMLEDVAGSKTLYTVCPDSVKSVKCALCEHTFICEEHTVAVVNLASKFWPAGGHFAGLKQCFCCSSLHKADAAVLLLGFCPPTASSMSSDVLNGLLIVLPCSVYYTHRHSKPSCHNLHSCAMLDELL